MLSFLKNAASTFGAARAFALGLLVLLLAIRIWDPLPLEIFRLKTFDIYQTISPRPYEKLPVTIVDIDEKSLAELGQWPWPRSTLADILKNIAKAGGIAVAFDVVFAEADRLSPDEFSKANADISPQVRAELATLPNTDAVFANAIRQMRIVLGQAGRAEDIGANRPSQAQTPVALLGPDPTAFMFRYPHLLRNLDILEDASLGRGLFSIYPDWDSIVRRPALVAIGDEKIQPALSVELLRVATGQNAFAVKSNEAGISTVVVGGVEVPTDRNGRIWVHYSHSMPERFVSAADIATGTFDTSKIQNHLILVGPSAIGLLDLKPTPLDPAMPGVEVHAQILENILSQSFLKRPNFALGAELIAAVALSLLVIFFVPILGALPVLALGFVLAAGWVSGSWYFFVSQKVLIDPIYPLLASLSAFLLLVFVNYRREEVRRQEIRSAFGQYLAPDYVELIANNPDSLSLGGEKRRMTILFSDVRGFTQISESFKDDPQGLTTLMNRFLTPLSNAIIEQRGTIDKYMGDAIMAFWNAPLEDDRQEFRACSAALAMIEDMNRMNRDSAAEADGDNRRHIPLNVGIGINSGDCVVGNMGSEFRFDYSVLGDTVNLASRLEGQTKSYGVSIIIGHKTAEVVQNDFAIFEIDLIRVKGKREPERIFCLYGGNPVLDQTEFQKWRTTFTNMLAHYRVQNWHQAEADCLDLMSGGDEQFMGLAATFLERIKEFQITPPPADWDGVYSAQTK